MSNDRPMTWDELCLEMVKQRKRAEKAEAEREKLIGALEKIAVLLKAHPEQIRKAAWKYKVYAIVTAALA